ncbi:hypothetical protein ACOME3_008108 [Neoechinorhynchus agilis]
MRPETSVPTHTSNQLVSVEKPKRKKRRLTTSPSTSAKTPSPQNLPRSSLSHLRPIQGDVCRKVEDLSLIEQINPSSYFDRSSQSQEEGEDLRMELASALNERDDVIGRLQECRSEVDVLKASLSSATSAVQRMIEEEAVIDRQRARDVSSMNCTRLGQYIPQKHAITYCEVWRNGLEYEKLDRIQKVLHKRREILEKEKKALSKRRTDMNRLQQSLAAGLGRNNDSAESWSNEYCDNPQLLLREFCEHDDLVRIRTAALKKEETELMAEYEKLDKEKSLHIREMKRLLQEDNSTFYQNPPELKINCTITFCTYLTSTSNGKRFLMVKLLGKGGFSEVHKAYDLKEFRYVACKIHMLNKEWSREKKMNYIRHGIRENDILRTVNHPRIVQFIDAFDMDQDWFCTVLEFFDGKDLDLVLKEQKQLAEKEARSILNQIVSALLYLNTCVKPPVIHYDLKPANVLVGTGNDYGKVKLTDFGLSKQMHDDVYDPERGMDLTSQGAGTYWYLPPEVFVQSLKPPKISSKVDVWSVGCLYFQCLFGRKPFGHNLSQSALLECETILKAKHVQFPVKPTTSNEGRAFISYCLTYEVRQRPDIKQLAESDYLQGSVKRTSSHSIPTISNSIPRPTSVERNTELSA